MKCRLLGLWFILAITASFQFAFGDGYNQTVILPGWTVETSERELPHRKPTKYPLWNLMDGNPKTTWVYGAQDYPKPIVKSDSLIPGYYYVAFRPDQPAMLDELRIMIGYNKSRDLYYRNSRPIEIAIFDEFPYTWGEPPSKFRVKPVRRLHLSDQPGDKSIKLPKKRYSALYVVFTTIAKGAIDDLCVSEITPRMGGVRAIPTPSSFLYTPGTGDDCGCGASLTLTTRFGKKLAVANNEDPRYSFSPNGRFLAGFKANSNSTNIWVYDLNSGRRLWTRTLSKGRRAYDLVWTKSGLTIPYGKYGPATLNSQSWIPLGKFVWVSKP